MKIFFIAEGLSAPFDEGFKNITFSLFNQLSKRENILSITKDGNNTGSLKVVKTGLNKLFLNANLRLLIEDYSPDIILYVPYASCTFNSFLRAKVLKLMGKKAKIAMLRIQYREYSFIQDFLIRNFLRPDLLFLPLGDREKDFFLKRNIKVKMLPPAVDNSVFSPAVKGEKEKIRSEYGIPSDKKIVLHVGHIRQTRNLECFIDVQHIENVQVVVVGSTSTPKDGYLKDKLIAAGVRVIDEYIPDISKIYRMSDIYVFPVVKNTAAIDMPLSVLEALACNLFVITTQFGGLEYYFKEGSGFKYFDTREELIALIRGIDRADVHNSKKVERFTWDRFTNDIISACEELA